MGCTQARVGYQDSRVGYERENDEDDRKMKSVLITALQGNLKKDSLAALCQLTKYSSIKVFISSSGTEAALERSILLEEILPEMQETGRLHDIHVNFVDIHSAAPVVHTKSKHAWASHLHHIEACSHESSGMFFLSLLGDIYGLCPIPSRVDQMVYELTKSQPAWNDLSGVVDSWYTLDENSIPLQYILTDINHIDDTIFWTYAKKLRMMLDNTIMESFSIDVVVGNSITDFEIRYAMSLDTTRCYWIHRKFLNDIPRKEKEFCDTWKDAKKLRHLKLSKHMYIKKLPFHEINCDLSVNTYKDHTSKDRLEYAKQWKMAAIKVFRGELESVISRRKRWLSTGNGIGIPGIEIDEMIHHCQLAAQHCEAFRGRKSLVNEAIRRIKSNEKGPGAFPSISLCLGGSPGNGKGALASHLVLTLGTVTPSIPRIIRFCGSSVKSNDNTSLLVSVILQIQVFYQLPITSIPSTFEEARSKFQDLLKKYAIILFFVDIDLVQDYEGNPVFLKCLNGIDRHADSRVILTFSDVTRLGFELPAAADPVLEVTPFSKEKVGEALLIIQDILQTKNRKLTNQQWDIVLNRISPTTTAFYMTVAVEVISSWVSSADCCELSATDTELVDQLFGVLEMKYGASLVRHAIGYLSIIRSGMSDKEMQDLLSLSDTVLQEVNNSLNFGLYDRVPLYLWTSLSSDIRGFISNSRTGFWCWRSKRMRNIVMERFSKEELLIYYQYVGLYFSNNIPEIIQQSRLISTHTLLLNCNDTSLWDYKAIINQRRCRESVVNLLKAELLYEAVQELCSFDYIYACTSSRIHEHIVGDLNKLCNKILECQQSACTNIKSLTFSNVSLRRSNCETYNCTYKSCDTKSEYATVYHFYKWLYENIDVILKNPFSLMRSTASNQPECSIVKARAAEYFASIDSHIEDVTREKTSFPVFKAIPFSSSPFRSSLKVDDVSEVITGVVLCEDGSKFVGDGDDSTIRIWHIATGACLETIDNLTAARMLDQSSITALTCNVDCSIIVAGLSNSCIKVWNYPSTQCLHTLLEHTDYISCLRFSRDGSKFVSGSSDCSVKEWNVVDGTCVQTLLAHSYPVTSVCFSSDGRRIASGSEDRTIIIWDNKGTKWYRVLRGHSYMISSVCFSSDDRHVISGSWDKTIKIWESVVGICLITLTGHTDYVRSVFCGVNMGYILSTSFDSTIKIWDSNNGTLLQTLEGHGESVSDAIITQNDDQVISVSWNKTVKVWDLKTGACLQTLERDPTTNLYTLSRTNRLDLNVEPLIIEAEESKSEDGDDEVDKHKISFEVNEEEKKWLKGHSGWVTCVCESPNGALVASGSVDNTIKIWDLATNTCTKSFEGHYKSITVIKFDSNGGLLLSGSCDSSVKLWDMWTGKCLESFDSLNCNILSVDFSPDGASVLSSSSDFSVQVWDIRTAKCIQKFTVHSSMLVSLRNPSSSPYKHTYSDSNFGRMQQSSQHKDDLCTSIILVYYSKARPVLFSKELDSILLGEISSSTIRPVALSQLKNNSLKFWDLSTETCLLSLEGHNDSITSACLSDDEAWLVTGSEDKSIKLWDMTTHLCAMEFIGHKDDVKSVSFNGDASRICSGSNDSTVRVWDARTGSCIHLLKGHTDWIKAVHFSFDGTRIISGADDKTVRVWDARTGLCIKTLAGT